MFLRKIKKESELLFDIINQARNLRDVSFPHAIISSILIFLFLLIFGNILLAFSIFMVNCIGYMVYEDKNLFNKKELKELKKYNLPNLGGKQKISSNEIKLIKNKINNLSQEGKDFLEKQSKSLFSENKNTLFNQMVLYYYKKEINNINTLSKYLEEINNFKEDINSEDIFGKLFLTYLKNVEKEQFFQEKNELVNLIRKYIKNQDLLLDKSKKIQEKIEEFNKSKEIDNQFEEILKAKERKNLNLKNSVIQNI